MAGVGPFPDIARHVHDAVDVATEAAKGPRYWIGRAVARSLLLVVGDPAQGGTAVILV